MQRYSLGANDDHPEDYEADDGILVLHEAHLAEVRRLQEQLESQERDWQRLNRVFKSTSDKTIDQDIEIERLRKQIRVLEGALVEAAKDHINPEGTFGEALKRVAQIKKWEDRARAELGYREEPSA